MVAKFSQNNMIKILVMISVMFVIGCSCCDRKADELVTVVALFRHGDKTPKSEYFDVYPNNPWGNPKLWNNSDLGSVTTRGKLNIYDRGKWLRERYAKFLPEKYSGKNIYVLSSDSDRVLISAQLLLNGMFPPKGTDVWNEKLAWQPIPIHTISDKEDMVIAQKADCKKFEKLFQKQLLLETHNFDEVKYLSKFTGKTLESLEQVYKLYKLLRIVEENGLVLPSWAHEALPVLKKKTDLLCETYSMTKEMQRFKSGPFFHVVLDHLDAVINKSPNAPKMLLFAGHSRTVTNVLVALNAYTEQPPYCSTLIFELKKNCNGSLVVDVYYQTTANGPPVELIKNEPYEFFKKRLKPQTMDPKNWEKECRTSFIF